MIDLNEPTANGLNARNIDFEDAFAPERLLPETLNAHELAPPARLAHRELAKPGRVPGGAQSA